MSAANNETYTGTQEDDTHSTGQGTDYLSGRSGNDILEGGLGNDFLEGGSGNDTLIGDEVGTRISLPDFITMQEDRDISITFDSDGAGYQNSIGYYRVEQDSGEIYDVGLVWANASAVDEGGELIEGVSTETISVETGNQIGFFIVSNGAGSIDENAEGVFEFRNQNGGPATINDIAPTLVFVDTQGTVEPVENAVFHSAAFGDRIDLNADSTAHTVGILQTEEGEIQLGFEDLPGGGDKDFNDVIVTVDIGEATATVLNEHFDTNVADETENLDAQSTDTNFNPADTADRLHGEMGSDTLEGMQGNDLLVGDRAGDEWELIDGEWVYDASKIENNGDAQDTDDDILIGGHGNDVLNGGFGDDHHVGGAGDDRINAGFGRDFADGGEGADTINLEGGNDIGQGGLGNDTIHAGAGNDTVYGDQGNVLNNGDYGADPHSGIGFSFLGESGSWSGGETDINADNQQIRSIVQSIETVEGESYSMNFDLALGSLSALGAASVEIYWNGELLQTVEPGSALFEQISISVEGTGGSDSLEFREIIELDAVTTSQSIYTTLTDITVDGEVISVDGFAPGQSNLYQVIGDQFYIFDTNTQEYEAVGEAFGFNVNAAGFNPSDNLIYGFATNKNATIDANGDEVVRHDVIAIDANGNSYRIGHVSLESEFGGSAYIGDFGPDGSMWVMNGGHRSELFRVDVNNVGPDGELTYEAVPLPSGMGGIADWAWVESEQAFVGVSSGGTIYKIDPYNLVDGVAVVETSEITSLVTENGVVDGVPTNSAWGAVFTDADGNLYAGFNGGNHDLDSSTANSGGIYQITGFDSDTAQAVLLSESPLTSSNDGASDPRSISSFMETDGDASVLIRNVSLTGTSGDGDTITGGEGDDTIFGEGGADEIFGNEGQDRIDGGVGDDTLFGDAGDDFVFGGEGNDHIEGGLGSDELSGNDGDDVVLGGAGSDVADGGGGEDKVVGGAGADTIIGGAGDDHLWGGEWTADGSVDLFVFEAGSGQDMIHDFEVDADVIDLSSYGISWDDLQNGIQDHGWAVSIELGAVGGEQGDRVFLTNVSTSELTEDNFDFGG